MVSLPAKLRASSRFFRFRKRPEHDPDDTGFRNLRRFLGFMKPYKLYVWGAFITGLIRMILPLYMPRFLQNVIDRVLIPSNISKPEKFQLLWHMMPLLAVLMVIHVAVTLGRIFWGNLVAANVVRDVRYTLVRPCAALVARVPYAATDRHDCVARDGRCDGRAKRLRLCCSFKVRRTCCRRSPSRFTCFTATGNGRSSRLRRFRFSPLRRAFCEVACARSGVR